MLKFIRQGFTTGFFALLSSALIDTEEPFPIRLIDPDSDLSRSRQGNNLDISLPLELPSSPEHVPVFSELPLSK